MSLKLNIGCGRRKKKGYVNIDVAKSKRSKPDVIADCRELPYNEGSVDIIESYHLIEHLGRFEAIDALKHWYNLLVDGGKLVMELPDLEEDIKLFLNGNEEMIHSIFGRHRNEFDYHKYGYTKPMMRDVLESIGYKEIEFEEPTDYHSTEEPCMRVVAKK